MRKKLQTIYIKSDTSCRELAKTALTQLILKVIYFYNEPITNEAIKGEVNGILKATLNIDRVDDAITFLLSEEKIMREGNGFILTPSRRRKFDIAFHEHEERQNRIVEKYFSPTKSEKSIIKNWFENVTIDFFTEFRSEWIAEKAYDVRKENAYDGLRNIVKKGTNEDSNINNEDKEWLIAQYIKFFKSNDEDLNSVFWDYGTCAYSSSLITASNAANQITIETIKDSKFILDTNILMYLTLESGKYYESYNALGQIFSKLNIQPGYFFITRDEYIRSTSNKKEQIINIINNYDDSVIEQLDDDFIKTARGRQCENEEDYNRFFNDLLDLPTEFTKDIRLALFDDETLNSAIERGAEDEELIELLNTYFKNRHCYRIDETYPAGWTDDKGKKRKPLMHDAGLIRGAEYLRTNEKCFILTREISVKQYGILNAVRDEPFISIGLDTLISLLAIDSGGIDIDPNNFKPLFAQIIKLALLPEKGTFQLEDLARIFDIEQNIANLPDEDVISIAKDMHKYQMSDMTESKITVEIQRKFQRAKMQLKSDLRNAETEIIAERKQKEIYKKSSTQVENALRKNLTKEISAKHHKWYRRKKLLYFLIFPIITVGLTFLVVLQYKKNLSELWLNYLISFVINVIAWFCINFFILLPRLTKSYKARQLDINKEVEERMIEETKDAN